MRVADIHPGTQGYLFLFAWVFAEQIGLPLPAAPALIAAGVLAAGGSLNVALVAVVALGASVLADYLWYCAGSLRSEALRRFLQRHPESRVLRYAEHLFARHGSRTLLFAKFVPGLSLAAPPLSGMGGMSVAQFLLFDTLGSLVWTGGFIGTGYFFGCNIDTGSATVSPRLCVCLSVALVLGLAALGSARRLWRKHRAQPLAPAIVESVELYKEDPAELRWLADLITGEPTPNLKAAFETPDPNNAGHTFFAQWMVTWSRKLVIAEALGKMTTELRGSARRMALAQRAAGCKSAAPPEWRRRHPVHKVQVERALAAIDVFPRCALLLRVFERLSLEDAAVLLGASKELVTNAQAIGLTELARNLEHEQGWVAEFSALPRPRLAEMQPV